LARTRHGKKTKRKRSPVARHRKTHETGEQIIKDGMRRRVPAWEDAQGKEGGTGGKRKKLGDGT